MALLASKVRVHRVPAPRAAGPILPNLETRAGESTNTSHHRRILCRSPTPDPVSNLVRDRNRNVLDRNIQS
jgi:hypothetical protein